MDSRGEQKQKRTSQETFRDPDWPIALLEAGITVPDFTMSENIMRVPASELTTVRIICTKCKRGAIEVGVEHLGRALNDGCCRLCGHEHFKPTADLRDDVILQLRLALEGLQKKGIQLRVEFDVPASVVAMPAKAYGQE